MEQLGTPLGVQLEAPPVDLATVCDVVDDHIVVVSLRQDPSRSLRCTLLHQIGTAAKTIALGQSVLVWIDHAGSGGVILGALGTRPETRSSQAHTPNATEGDMPEELLIEARESLTLRVGDGSITIRADGKILIKGKELVSHAKNVNRIKGGAVAIN
jgi:hypothetical protein